MKHTIYNSDFVAWAISNPNERFHAVLCDPPYGLEFMGKDWDKFDIRQPGDPTLPVSKAGSFRRAKVRHAASPGYGNAQEAKARFQKEVQKWGEALLPILYPGALVFMFGGTRMWHHLATGMEDAGFHLWDTFMWLYGTGFPKGHDISKAIDAQNGDKRTEVIGRYQPPGMDKPWNLKNAKDERTVTISASSRNNLEILAPASEESAPWAGHKTPQLKPAWEPILCFKAPSTERYTDLALKYGSGLLNVDGGRIGDRYPANLILDEDSASVLDGQTGILTSGKSKPEYRKKAKNNVYGKYKNVDMPINVIGDSGGASRFFYVAKATQKERSAGLDSKNPHPTVKPIELNRWLASLLLPPDSVKPRRLLVPFAGVASEMIGAMHAGWDEVVGIEMDADYCKIAEARLNHHKSNKIAKEEK